MSLKVPFCLIDKNYINYIDYSFYILIDDCHTSFVVNQGANKCELKSLM